MIKKVVKNELYRFKKEYVKVFDIEPFRVYLAADRSVVQSCYECSNNLYCRRLEKQMNKYVSCCLLEEFKQQAEDVPKLKKILWR